MNGHLLNVHNGALPAEELNGMNNGHHNEHGEQLNGHANNNGHIYIEERKVNGNKGNDGSGMNGMPKGNGNNGNAAYHGDAESSETLEKIQPSPIPTPLPEVPEYAQDNDFEITPDISNMTDEELNGVVLTVAARGIGAIEFSAPMDLRQWTVAHIRDKIKMRVGEVVVYPDINEKPPPGEGLNVPATITLYHCYPPDSKDEINKSGEARVRYERKIKRMTEQKGARFISYDQTGGRWRFYVDHF